MNNKGFIYVSRLVTISLIIAVVIIIAIITFVLVTKKDNQTIESTNTTQVDEVDAIQASTFKSQKLQLFRYDAASKSKEPSSTFTVAEAKEKIQLSYNYSDAGDDSMVHFVVFSIDSAKEIYSTLEIKLPKDKKENYFMLNLPDATPGSYFAQAIDTKASAPLQRFDFTITP